MIVKLLITGTEKQKKSLMYVGSLLLVQGMVRSRSLYQELIQP